MELCIHVALTHVAMVNKDNGYDSALARVRVCVRVCAGSTQRACDVQTVFVICFV